MDNGESTAFHFFLRESLLSQLENLTCCFGGKLSLWIWTEIITLSLCISLVFLSFFLSYSGTGHSYPDSM